MTTPTGERADLLRILTEQRETFLVALHGIDDEQARRRTTASELTLGGLARHLAQCYRTWFAIMAGRGPEMTAAEMADPEQYLMRGSDTVEALVADFRVAFDELAAALADADDLDRTVPLPSFPWATGEPQRWSLRYIVLHLFRETTHHSGHADIIRESLDGASTTARLAEVLGL
ncbi:MAG TPA: DinB family protein [Actinocatenispora sp.]